MNKIIFILVFFISSVSLSAVTTSDSSTKVDNSDQIKILYEKAEKMIKDESFEKSIKLLKKLIRREDLSGFRADIYNLLGYSYRKSNKPDLDKSFSTYMMALEIDPNHLGAHEYLGELYLMMGKKAKAQELLSRLELLSGIRSSEYLDLEKAISNF